MEFSKIVFLVACIGARTAVVSSAPTTSASVVSSASTATTTVASSPSTTLTTVVSSASTAPTTMVSNAQGVTSVSNLEFLVKNRLAQSVKHTIAEMTSLYTFITRDLLNPTIHLGLGGSGFPALAFKQSKDKLSEAYDALSHFRIPLYMAHSYEMKKGPSHHSLASNLKKTSQTVNTTIATVKKEMIRKGLNPGTAQAATNEQQMDQATQLYLQNRTSPGNNFLQTAIVTDDLVKTYRNYVIMYTLYDVIMVKIIPNVHGV